MLMMLAFRAGCQTQGASKAKLMLGFWEWDFAIRAADAHDAGFEAGLSNIIGTQGTADANDAHVRDG